MHAVVDIEDFPRDRGGERGEEEGRSGAHFLGVEIFGKGGSIGIRSSTKRMKTNHLHWPNSLIAPFLREFSGPLKKGKKSSRRDTRFRTCLMRDLQGALLLKPYSMVP